MIYWLTGLSILVSLFAWLLVKAGKNSQKVKDLQVSINELGAWQKVIIQNEKNKQKVKAMPRRNAGDILRMLEAARSDKRLRP